MASSSRTPPRFVPTLTTVVEIPPELPAEPPVAPPAVQMPDASPPEPASGGGSHMFEDFNFGAIVSTPPRAQPAPSVSRAAAAAAMQVSEEDAFRLEEQLLHRVLQRVDFSLEERLTDTVSAAVQRQLDVMLPKLRSEIETVLRALVVEALAQELSETPGSTPPLTPHSLG
jgi:hypothetical protein